jgi:aconitate hydratase
MMGILPLEFAPGTSWQSLLLTGEEVFDIPDLGDKLQPRQAIMVVAKGFKDSKATKICFPMTVRIDTPVELDYYRNGGILQTVLRKLMKA